jgi:DNA-binding IclR family transcriptional regulator
LIHPGLDAIICVPIPMSRQSESPGAPDGGPERAPAQRSYADLRGVGRAFALLEQIAERPMRASDLARALDMKWTTAHRTLTYLASTGYVERDEATGRYFVGVRAYALGSSYVSSLSLSESARPYLHAASIMSQATAQLVKRDDRQSVVLSVCDPGRDHVPETTIGCNFPLHCGSKGHVLLAFANPDFVDDYLARRLARLTPYTVVDPGALRSRLDEVRERGYALTDRDVRVFSSSVAAPVRDPADNVVASVTLVVPPDEIRERRHQLTEMVVRTARSISHTVAANRRTAATPD